MADVSEKMTSVVEVLSKFLRDYETVLVQVRQDGRRAYLPLKDIEDQRVVLKVLRDSLRSFEETLPKKKSTEEEAA